MQVTTPNSSPPPITLLQVLQHSRHAACLKSGSTIDLCDSHLERRCSAILDAVESVLRTELLDAIAPSTLDQASKWLEEMQHRLNLCIETKQNVHPRTFVAFVVQTMSAVIQYYCAVGNMWGVLCAKHQLRDSDITLDRIYSMLSEFMIELRLNEEQEKITQLSLDPATLR